MTSTADPRPPRRPAVRSRPPAALAAAALLLAALPARAQDSAAAPPPPPPADASAAAVFQRLAPAVVRIEVQESGSRAKSGVGSGFFVSTDGLLVTNYHVVSRLVHRPASHAARATAAGGSWTLTLLAVDVVHDLAVLRASGPAPSLAIAVAPRELAKGTRVLALGHPRDLGLSIVEGTYNGRLEHTATARLHYTGPINPGMSGGPAVTDDGALVGVNVATMGEEVAFLVPADAVAALLARVPAAPPDRAGFLAGMTADLAALAERTMAGLFTPGGPSVALDGYRVPTAPDSSFRCWGDSDGDEDEAPGVRVAVHGCSMDESIFLSETLGAGLARFEHELVRGQGLGRLRLLAALEGAFEQALPFDGTAREVTRFHCRHANLRTAAHTWRSALCVRRLRDFPGLYEGVFRSVSLGVYDAGLITSLTLSGVPFDLIRTLTARFLEAVGSTR